MQGNLYVYAYMKLDEDSRLSNFQELGGRISSLTAQLSTAGSFIQPEILAIPGEKLNSFLNSTVELDEYRFYLEDFFEVFFHGK